MALPTPLYVRYSLLTFEILDETGQPTGTTFNYECSATNIGLVSSGGELTELNTLCPDGSFSEAAPRTWALNVTAVQDVESSDSFLFLLMDNEGATAHVTWYPKTDNQKSPVGFGWEGDVKVTLPDQVGGVDIANYATFTVSLPFQGTPSRIDSNGDPVNPSGGDIEATGVVAGAPGSFTPAGAVVPVDLPALSAHPNVGDTALVSAAEPAWDTTGDYIVLGDESHAWWDGTNWQAGEVT